MLKALQAQKCSESFMRKYHIARCILEDMEDKKDIKDVDIGYFVDKRLRIGVKDPGKDILSIVTILTERDNGTSPKSIESLEDCVDSILHYLCSLAGINDKPVSPNEAIYSALAQRYISSRKTDVLERYLETSSNPVSSSSNTVPSPLSRTECFVEICRYARDSMEKGNFETAHRNYNVIEKWVTTIVQETHTPEMQDKLLVRILPLARGGTCKKTLEIAAAIEGIESLLEESSLKDLLKDIQEIHGTIKKDVAQSLSQILEMPLPSSSECAGSQNESIQALKKSMVHAMEITKKLKEIGCQGQLAEKIQEKTNEMLKPIPHNEFCSILIHQIGQEGDNLDSILIHQIGQEGDNLDTLMDRCSKIKGYALAIIVEMFLTNPKDIELD